MEQLEKLMLWGFGILAWMSVALSSFGTQDQQLGGEGGFDTESCKPMIFFGYVSTGIFSLLAWQFTKEKMFAWLGLLCIIGGYLWVYVVKHPIFKSSGGWGI